MGLLDFQPATQIDLIQPGLGGKSHLTYNPDDLPSQFQVISTLDIAQFQSNEIIVFQKKIPRTFVTVYITLTTALMHLAASDQLDVVLALCQHLHKTCKTISRPIYASPDDKLFMQFLIEGMYVDIENIRQVGTGEYSF